MSIDLDSIRTELSARQVAPFHPWQLPRPRAAWIRRADAQLHTGWLRPSDRAVIELMPPYDWEAADVAAVAAGQLRQWMALDALLAAHGTTGSWAYLEPAVELAEDWEAHGSSIGAGWSAPVAAGRGHRLAYLVAATAPQDSVEPVRWRALMRLARRHADRLASLASTELEPIDRLLVVAALRSMWLRLGPGLEGEPIETAHLVAALRGAVDADGVTSAPTTDAHIAVVAAIAAADEDDPVADLSDLRRPLERGLAWLIGPGGSPANLGVMSLDPVTSAWKRTAATVEIASGAVAPELRHALTAGDQGAPASAGVATLRGGAIEVFKPSWPVAGDTHSMMLVVDRTTGDFTWSDRGRPLVIAPGTTPDALAGTRGRPLSDMRRWLRVRQGNRLRVEPLVTGEARARSSVVNGVWWCEVAVGEPGRRHVRLLAGAPGRWLVVVDRVDQSDIVDSSMLLAPGLATAVTGGGYMVSAADRPVMWATVMEAGAHPAPALGGRGGWWAPRPAIAAPAAELRWTPEPGVTAMTTVLSLDGPAAPAMHDDVLAFSIEETTFVLTVGDHGLTDVQEVPS